MVKKNKETIVISPPKFEKIKCKIKGTAPLVQNRFSAKAMQKMKQKMELGQAAKKGSKREARDFDDDFKQAQHISEQGWIGIPAAAIRNACISACKMVGFHMTKAKMSVFCEADGIDEIDGSPLVKLIANKPEILEMPVRIQQTTNISIRPMWRKWELDLTLKYDADQFTSEDILNLLNRAGQQVGIGEGRPDSKTSNGLGFGTFEIAKVHGIIKKINKKSDDTNTEDKLIIKKRGRPKKK